MRENDRNNTIQAIKAALKARGLKYSVTGGRGTAWGWITVDLMPAVFKTAAEEEIKAAYRKLAVDLKLTNNGYTSESIPAGGDYYTEYIQRAKGETPTTTGTPYWD